MEYGIVYLLTNPVMPGLVKIGMTTQEDIDKRMKELYTTGVPVPFECKFACKVKKSDCLKIEKAFIKPLTLSVSIRTVSSSVINVEQAQAILELFHHEDVTEEVTERYRTTSQMRTKLPAQKHMQNVHRSISMRWDCRKAMFSSGKMTINFCHYSFKSAKCVIKEKKLLSSALSAKLKGYKVKHIQPTPHWLFNDRLLSEVYDETYPFEE